MGLMPIRLRAAVKYLTGLAAIAVALAGCGSNARPISAPPTRPQESQPYLKQVTLKQGSDTYHYPQIIGMANLKRQQALNQALRTAGTPKPSVRATDAMQSSYTLLLKRGAFYEVMLSSYETYPGAMQGLPGRTIILMNLQSGALYRIRDLFKPYSDYLAVLSAGVREADTHHMLDIYRPFTGVTAQDGFYVTDSGVTVFFRPNEWTPAAKGYPAFTVPYSSLSAILDTSSPLWRVLHSPAARHDAAVYQKDLATVRGSGYALVSVPFTGYAAAPAGSGQTFSVFAGERNSPNGAVHETLFFFIGDRPAGSKVLPGASFDQLTPTGLATVQASYGLVNNDHVSYTITCHWDGARVGVSAAVAEPSQ